MNKYKIQGGYRNNDKGNKKKKTQGNLCNDQKETDSWMHEEMKKKKIR